MAKHGNTKGPGAGKLHTRPTRSAEGFRLLVSPLGTDATQTREGSPKPVERWPDGKRK